MARPGSTPADVEKLHHAGRLAEAIDGSYSILASDPPVSDRLAALAVLGNAAFDSGDVVTALGAHREVCQLAQMHALRELHFDAALALFGRESQYQAADETLPNLSRVRQLAAETGSARALAALHLGVARIEAMRGLYANSRRHLELSRHLSTGASGLVWASLHVVDSALESHVGNLGRATRAAEAGLAAAHSNGRRGVLAAGLANLGSILFLAGDERRSRELLCRAMELTSEMLLLRSVIVDTFAQFSLDSNDPSSCSERLAECAELIAQHKVPARSWYDLMHQGTRCSFYERRGDWPAIVAIVDEVNNELARRQYRALRTTLLCAKARALAALGEHDRADQTLAGAVTACPRSAVDPLIILEATRAACDAFRGRSSAAGSRFDRALAGCRAIGHRYHERWIVSLRDRLVPKGTVKPAGLPEQPSAGDVLADVAAILGAGNSIDLLAHRTAALLKGTSLHGRVETESTGGHEYQATPTVSVGEDASTYSLSLRASDRRVTLKVPRVDSLDDVVLLKNVGDIVRLAVTRAADAEHDDDAPNLWPSAAVTDDGDAIFRSPRMVELLRVAARLADTDMPVLLTGETGTGKEIIARLIHAHSRHRRGPFVPFNGPSISKDLVESQLFGHRRGAFTGAHESTPGMIRAAEGGTLFLDEVGDLDIGVQPKLLRFIEYREIQPLGDAKPQSVHVRLVAATNADLDTLCREGRFRRDLYFRLNVARIALPPLRERKDEIPAMASLFLTQASRECGRSGLRLADDFVAALLLYSWPGNIRELLNEVRRAVALAEDGDTLTARDLAPDIARPWLERPIIVAAAPSGAGVFVRLDQPLNRAVQQIEEQFIERALDLTGGRVSEAARILGLSRKGLFLKRRRRKQAANAGAAGDADGV